MVEDGCSTSKTSNVDWKHVLTFGNRVWYLKILETDVICYKMCCRAQNECWGLRMASGGQRRLKTDGSGCCITELRAVN